jgi:hypothetical protein
LGLPPTTVGSFLVAAPAAAFLGRATGVDEPEALLNYGGGIALVIAALGFFTCHEPKQVEPGNDEDTNNENATDQDLEVWVIKDGAAPSRLVK